MSSTPIPCGCQWIKAREVSWVIDATRSDRLSDGMRVAEPEQAPAPPASSKPFPFLADAHPGKGERFNPKGSTRLLITGASGLLGINLTLAARTRGHRVTAAYHRNAIHVPGGLCVESNLLKTEDGHELFSQSQPEWIIHCAALTDVDYCEAHPAAAFLLNEEVPRILAAAARRSGAGFVYISTDAVFDGRCGCYSEHDTPVPVNV
ncbi:MAG: NAD-dependent epimerase/dehydratase family protein [Acidobacteria bacterium]|nr:NAD-dependent epimerase/dehydratase family protein [Acidobacteriota bacterium]